MLSRYASVLRCPGPVYVVLACGSDLYLGSACISSLSNGWLGQHLLLHHEQCGATAYAICTFCSHVTDVLLVL